MVGKVSQMAGQELAQIAREKRGPFERARNAQDTGDVARAPEKPNGVASNPEISAVTKSRKLNNKHSFGVEVPVMVRTLIENAQRLDRERVTESKPGSVGAGEDIALDHGVGNGRSVLLALQEIDPVDKQSAGHGLALGHDKDRPGRVATPKAPREPAPDPLGVQLARPRENSEAADFIKRFEHRDFGAEAALNLLSGGQEKARDASLSVTFQAEIGADDGRELDRGFIAQFINGAEKV